MANQDLGRVTGHTRPIAILGYPIHHSLSPWIHNAAFAAAGLDYVYLAVDVRPEDLETAVAGIRVLDFAGFTLTAPHKETVMPLLDDLTEEARAIGSVNTVANRNGRWVGTNTDAVGFQRMLELNGMYRPGMKTVMLGAGGAARAGFYILGKVCSELRVFNRTVSRGEKLIRSMEPVRPEGALWEALPMDEGLLARHLAGADLLVNSTSLGMSPNVDASPLPEGIALRPECGVADMIYSPPKTKLIRTAEARECKTTSGHLMLLYQAVEAFKFWTGVDPDVAAMDAGLRAGMEARNG